MAKRGVIRRCLAGLVPVVCAISAAPAAGISPHLTLEIRDYAAMPITGLVDGKGPTDGLLAWPHWAISQRSRPVQNKSPFEPEFERASSFGGVDGTRTRDPRRDRPVF